jgi:adenine-specific DNA-methyltransferase
MQRQRKRAAWDGFLAGLDQLEPFGTNEWRRGNRVFRSDALEIWPRLDNANLEHAVVYADPPYSKEHYSRYYHVLESLERYDYPGSDGVGRYRDDRFRTPFSVRSEVERATDQLCSEIADRGWTFALSYPDSGLLTAGLGLDIEDILSRHFHSVRVAVSVATQHSTLGARHGDSRKPVNEYLWIAA